ncbi:MAG: hypothetical protein ACREMV_01935, partial [Gemmatimonadales bacterium]
VFEGWCIVELMGHRRLGGFVSEQQIAGSGFVRVDVWLPAADKPVMTQLYSPKAVYCLTPTTEELARKAAASSVPAPVQPLALRSYGDDDGGDHDDTGDDCDANEP